MGRHRGTLFSRCLSELCDAVIRAFLLSNISVTFRVHVNIDEEFKSCDVTFRSADLPVPGETPIIVTLEKIYYSIVEESAVLRQSQ